MYEILYNKRKRKYEFIFENKVLTSSKTKYDVLNQTVKCANSFLKVTYKKSFLKMWGLLVIYDKYKVIDNDFKIVYGNKNTEIKITINIKIPFTNIIIKIYNNQIDYSNLAFNTIYNKVYIVFKNKDGYGLKKRASYKIIDGYKSKKRSSKLKQLNNNTVIYFKQTSTNGLLLVRRMINITDFKRYQIKIFLAKIISKVMPKNKVLLYEKESAKYEESASVLYEKLIDLKYLDCYYIMDKRSKQIHGINCKYKKNIIYKGSFKNYLYFFRCRLFLGTEFIDHVIDLRVKNKYIEKHIANKNYKFVFLQHGVMYMLSIASGGRNFFKKGRIINDKDKIVVSSLTEAEHFINDGGYAMSDLYITGLPKFDYNNRNANASKIIIMPTWRPWEYHEAIKNVEDTEYYKMINEIYNAIPVNLRKNVIIMPHPLFLNLSQKSWAKYGISKYNSYEEILKETSVLITDYSSIATDAFSRGCNIIFWWKDLEKCMDKHKGHLMINEKNIYGDICFDSEELQHFLKKRYLKKQPENYIVNYKKIVQFDDGQNTNRLIELLKKDGLI